MRQPASLKDRILALRKQGLSYREIEHKLGCAQSTVSYFVNNTSKDRRQEYRRERRQTTSKELKQSRGSKCESCGFDKSLLALDWHHVNPDEKDFTISERRGVSMDKLWAEIKKCVLVCKNCHAMIHSKEIPCPPL